MLRNTEVVSISLPPKIFTLLESVARRTCKTRSEVIRDLLLSYSQDKAWEQIFSWGRETKEKFKISSEAEILKIIND